MDIYREIIYIVSNFVRVYILYRFFGVFFNRESVNKHKEIFLFCILFITTSIVSLMFQNAIINLIINLLMLSFISNIYSITIVKRILSILLIYVITLSLDVIVAFSIGKYLSGVIFYVVGNTVATLLFLITEFVIERKSDKASRNIDNKNDLLLLLIPFISMIILVIIEYNEKNNVYVLVIECIAILLININCFYLYNWIIKSYYKKYEIEILERQLESYENQLEITKINQDKINSIKHDMKHHMLAIDNMASKSENEEIIEYLKNIKNEIYNSKEYVASGNDAIDTILNYMISRAKIITNNIKVKIKVPKDVELNKFDMNIIFGNLLDNSLRALKTAEECELVIFVQYSKAVLNINIENSYSGILNKRGCKILSTKKTTEIHGIGLENVKRIVDKYNGVMEITTENQRFNVVIMLYI